MRKYVDRYWKGFSLAIICLTVEALCDLMQPTIMSSIVDVGVAYRDINYIVKKGLVMVPLGLPGETYCRELYHRISAQISGRIYLERYRVFLSKVLINLKGARL